MLLFFPVQEDTCDLEDFLLKDILDKPEKRPTIEVTLTALHDSKQKRFGNAIVSKRWFFYIRQCKNQHTFLLDTFINKK